MQNFNTYVRSISDVTLIAISSIYIDETLEALDVSRKNLNFGAVKIISDARPRYLPDGIVHEYCPKINDIMDFNRYVFRDFGQHVTTSHCLMVQYHAFILRPSLWEDSWLDYDYIGAPWPIKEGSYVSPGGERVRVGNGGFSLRSKYLLDLPKKYDIPLVQDQGYWNEDGNICVYHRERFKALGVYYAPVEVAAKFAYETDVPENKDVLPFGFHRHMR